MLAQGLVVNCSPIQYHRNFFVSAPVYSSPMMLPQEPCFVNATMRYEPEVGIPRVSSLPVVRAQSCDTGALRQRDAVSTDRAPASVRTSSPSAGDGHAVTQAVMRAALRLGLRMRTSELTVVAKSLVQHGFKTRKSLSALTDAVALELGVPANLATFLQIESVALPAWVKKGPLPPAAEPEPTNGDCRISAAVGAYANCDETVAPARNSIAYPAKRGSFVSMTDSNGGFPSPLRSYLPSSPRATPPAVRRSESSRAILQRSSTPWREEVSTDRRAASPSEARAYDVHIIRQYSARRLKSHDVHEMRVSSARRDKTPDAWLETSFNHRSPRMAMPRAGRCSIAGMDLPTRCAEQTAEVALTLPASGARLDNGPKGRLPPGRRPLRAPPGHLPPRKLLLAAKKLEKLESTVTISTVEPSETDSTPSNKTDMEKSAMMLPTLLGTVALQRTLANERVHKVK